MMKKIFNLYILGFALLMLVFTGCEEQEVADPISPDGYPTATITTDFTGSVINEGDEIEFTITLDKPFDYDVNFEYKIHSGSEASVHDDFEIEIETLKAYKKEAKIKVTCIKDNLIESDEALKVEFGIFYVGQRDILNPKSQNYILDVTVKSNDDIAPTFDPAHSIPAVDDEGLEPDVTVTLVFDEPVQYVAGKAIVLDEYDNDAGYQEVITEASKVTVDGNKVTVEHSDFPWSVWIDVGFEAGAFVDLAGNAIAESPVGSEHWFATRQEFPYNRDDFIGLFDVAEISDYDDAEGNPPEMYYYTDEITADPDNDNGIILNNYWNDGDVVKLELDPATGDVLMADQFLFYYSDYDWYFWAISLNDDIANSMKVGEFSTETHTFEIYTGVLLKGLGFYDKITSTYTPATADKAAIKSSKRKVRNDKKIYPLN